DESRSLTTHAAALKSEDKSGSPDRPLLDVVKLAAGVRTLSLGIRPVRVTHQRIACTQTHRKLT
ncbi:MAG: hypothetical protein AAGA01_08500, partial [Cyanobacteria bacterium P01_E01_bin.43]